MTAPADARGDTQWPRWEVFKQDTEGGPHRAVGSVHAADAEHALLMARSVYARRPAAVSLWVAPSEAVHAFTAEQLHEAGVVAEEPAEAEAEPVRQYLVFCKTSHRRSMTFVDFAGELSAAGPGAAVAAARLAFPKPPALTWWVVPADAVAASPGAEADAWFGPAKDKTYKQQSEYGTLAAGRRAKGRTR